MAQREDFPLVSGHLSIDLVNTEVVRRGVRHDLLTSEEDLTRWIGTMQSTGNIIPDQMELGEVSPDMLQHIRALRSTLRNGFEHIADGHGVSERWQKDIEHLTEVAPLSYKVHSKRVVPVPLGKPADALASLTAMDALNLLAGGELTALRRCANPECVLLFTDTTGRRKWCSMQICGNRMKVARHQSRSESATVRYQAE